MSMNISCNSGLVDEENILKMGMRVNQYDRNKARGKVKRLLMNIPVGYLIDDKEMDAKVDSEPMMSYDRLTSLISNKDELKRFLFSHVISPQ